MSNYVRKERAGTLISPFVGGGSFELAMLEANIVDNLHINDLDTGVYSLWWTIKNNPDYLIKNISKITPNKEMYYSAQEKVKSNYDNLIIQEAGWTSLLVNRLAYSGISNAGPLGGKNGTDKQLLSRWNTKTLIDRIIKINKLSDKIKITQLDAAELIEESYWNNNTTIFIDPPYVEKGEMLYDCFFYKADHVRLAVLLDSLYHGTNGADIIVTYDYNYWLKHLYEMPEQRIIQRKYSI